MGDNLAPGSRELTDRGSTTAPWPRFIPPSVLSRDVQDPSLTHVRLLVQEYTACFRFYRDQLGFDPIFGDAESGYADFESGDVTFALFDADEQAAALGEHPPAGQGRDGVCVVLRVEDIDEVADLLRDQEVELVGAPTDHPEWGIRTIHTRDPDGTLIEFNEPLDP